MDPATLVKGLISLANLPLYEKARIKFPPQPDYKGPKEGIATKVLENVLNKVVFSGQKYSTVFVNSQVSPHEDSNLAADLAIEYMTEKQQIQILCFIEAKRTSTSESYITTEVEEEALDYCREFFSDRLNAAPFVYAGTLVGVQLRLWIVWRRREQDLSLEPLWGSPFLGSNEDYKDLGDDSDGQEILKALHKMISIAPDPWIGTDSTQVIHSSGGGAIQLPSLGQPDFVPQPGRPPTPGPVHPSFSVGPT